MTIHRKATRFVRPLLWLGGGLAANLLLPKLLSNAAQHAEEQDFLDCHESSDGGAAHSKAGY